MAGRNVEPFIPLSAQLELPVPRLRSQDRNFDKGGRSFYFFDLDDNVLVLKTSIFVRDARTGLEQAVTTREYAAMSRQIGKPGPYHHISIDLDDRVGSFRRFRDLEPHELDGREQPFVQDMRATLRAGPVHFHGPSWPLFYHAVFNQRPIAIITARGHSAATMQAGLDLLVEHGHLPARPNFLGIYAVSNREVRAALGDLTGTRPTPELKRAAIIDSVEQAMRQYGPSPHHRFGMSDDDPQNIALILAAMVELKGRYPDNAFFVFDTGQLPVIKTEILADTTAASAISAHEQLELFG